MTTFGDQLYQHGGVPVSVAPAPYSMYRNAIFVDMYDGADGNDGFGIDRAKVTIQAGIDAAYAGDMIVVLGGRHILPSTGLVTPLYKTAGVDRGQITFIGGGNAFGDAVTLSASGTTAYPHLNVRSPGWRISGFRFVYATGTYGGSDTPAIHLPQPNLTGTTNTAQSYYTTIDNNYFFYCGAGICSSGAAYTVSIHNNTFEVCTGAGIQINNTSQARGRSWKIIGNTFINSIVAGTSGAHIDGGGGGWADTIVAHNYFDKQALICINFTGGRNNIVSKNVFMQNYVDASGHFTAGSSDMWIGNYVTGGGTTGVYKGVSIAAAT